MFENKIIAVAIEKSWTFMKKYFFLTSICKNFDTDLPEFLPELP